jgi:acetyltransferase-like isoleucine patch superfamily enzyme
MRDAVRPYELRHPKGAPRTMVETTSPLRWSTLVVVLRQMSFSRSVWWTLRYGRPIVLARGTSLRVARGGRLRMAPGSALFLGIAHQTPRSPVPAMLDVGRGAELSIGGTVQILRGARIVAMPGAQVRIGANTFLNDDASVIAKRSITIGSGCAIAWRTMIADSDFHALQGKTGRYETVTLPVTIGDNVWIGMGSILLKGVSIGAGSVVAAGSVVRGEIPPGVLFSGNPGRVIREGVQWRLLSDDDNQATTDVALDG